MIIVVITAVFLCILIIATEEWLWRDEKVVLKNFHERRKRNGD